MSKVKICGLFRPEDIEYVNEAMPDYIGFIIGFPKSHRNISRETLVQLTEQLHSDIKAVGVFVNAPMETIIELSEYLQVIQLHGAEDDCYIEKLKRALPEKEIWKAFKIASENDLQMAFQSKADRIVLDNGYGTGETFDWDLLKAHACNTNRAFIFAGGIGIENVREVVDVFAPEIIDISSGVEENKVKNKAKIQAIIKEIRA